jgi:formylglycine-generating enzyme required for sulfatase activity
MSMAVWLLRGVALVLTLLTAATPADAQRPANPDGVAVIVGNRTYKGSVPAVEFAHRDAEAMKRFVIDVLGFREGNVIDLRDATKTRLEQVFGSERSHRGQLFQFVRPKESDVVVFYSGHGVPGLRDRRGYLLPVDAELRTAEIDGFPLDLLYANLAKSDARSVTVYLDACFSGESAGGVLLPNASGLMVAPRLPATASGLTVIAAARGDQVASWDTEARHGLFTRHLLEALRGKADAAPYGNGDGKVTAAEAKAYLDREMTYAARRAYGREQNAEVTGAAERVLASLPAPGVTGLTPPPDEPILDPVEKELVALRNANVRRAADASSAVVATLPAGSRVHVAGKVAGANWYAVEREGKRLGYVFGDLLQEAAVVVVPPQPAPPPAPPVRPAVGVYPQPQLFRPGEVFKDCAECPEMVVIPAGSFVMGVAPGEEEREGLPDLFKGHSVPQHGVNVRSFMLGKYEVTVGEFARFVNETGHRTDGGCTVWNGAKWDIDQSRNWRNPGFGQGDRHPVACVSWDDAKAYTVWLSRKTGKGYRLATEAEWEYAARSGTSTARYWGNDANQGCGYANIADQTARSRVKGMTWGTTCGDGHAYTAPVGSFRMNGFGLHDMIGNVWEWTEDCWNENYAGAPTDGSSWQTGTCQRRVLRGGSWGGNPRSARSARRGRITTVFRFDLLGFRVARTFN